MQLPRIVFAVLAVAGALPIAAQVRLVYEVADTKLPVVSLKDGAPCYWTGTELRPAPGGGRFRLEPAAEYSNRDFEFHVQYRLRAKRVEEITAVGDATHVLGYSLVSGRNFPGDLSGYFYVAGWEVDGELRHVQVRAVNLLLLVPGIFQSLEVRSDEANGVFRFYLFDDQGRSVSGEKARAPEFRQLRDALDAGDRTRVLAWCQTHAARVPLSAELLQQVVRRGDETALAAVLMRKPPINAADSTGLGALQAAAQMGNEAAVDALLKAGAKLDQGPRTALFYAADQDAVEVVEHLLRAGAKTFPREEEQPSAVYAALDNGNLNLAARLLAADERQPTVARLNEWLGRAIARNRTSAVDFLLEHGADPKGMARDEPLLAIAADRGRTELVQLLLTRGADVNARAGRTSTALMNAAARGFEPVVEILLQAGADVTATDSNGWTAAAFAAAWAPDELKLRLVQRLLTAKPHPPRAKSIVLASALGLGRCQPLAEWLVHEQAAKFDTTLPNLDQLLCHAVELGATVTCRRALEQGISPSRKLHEEWTFAAMAKYYELTDVLADMQTRAGAKFSAALPKMGGSPVQLIEAPPAHLPAELLRTEGPLEAEVEVCIAPDGRVHFPRVRRTTLAALAPVAARQAGQMRFNSTEAKDTWRRVIVPLGFKRENFTDKLVLSHDQVDVAPVQLPASRAETPVAGGPLQAAWVTFVVSDTGTVVTPRVVAATDPSVADQAVATVARWRYQPAQKNGVPIACAVEEAVLLPSGSSVPTADLAAALPAESVGVTFPRLKKVWWADYPESLKKRRTVGVAVLRFTVTANGRVGAVRVMCSTDAALSAGLGEFIATWRLEPARRAGKAVDFEVQRAFVFRP